MPQLRERFHETSICIALPFKASFLRLLLCLVALAVKARDAQAYAAWGAALLQVHSRACPDLMFNTESFTAVICFECARKENGLSEAGPRQALTICRHKSESYNASEITCSVGGRPISARFTSLFSYVCFVGIGSLGMHFGQLIWSRPTKQQLHGSWTKQQQLISAAPSSTLQPHDRYWSGCRGRRSSEQRRRPLSAGVLQAHRRTQVQGVTGTDACARA